MDRIALSAEDRDLLGKKVKTLRKQGIIPAHVFGNKLETEHVSVKGLDFKKVYNQVGETGLIDLRIGSEKVRPVLVRSVQLSPTTDQILHIDFYQVNLNKKVTVAVPIELSGEEPEVVHSGEAVVIQPLSEVEVEALPTDLPEKITVDISTLKQINDAILVSGLPVPAGVTILADIEAVVVKLDNAISEETKKLMEEEAAQQAAVLAQAQAAGGAETPTEGETTTEGEEKPSEGRGSEESKGGEAKTEENKSEEAPKE